MTLFLCTLHLLICLDRYIVNYFKTFQERLPSERHERFTNSFRSFYSSWLRSMWTFLDMQSFGLTSHLWVKGSLLTFPKHSYVQNTREFSFTNSTTVFPSCRLLPIQTFLQCFKNIEFHQPLFEKQIFCLECHFKVALQTAATFDFKSYTVLYSIHVFIVRYTIKFNRLRSDFERGFSLCRQA